MSKAVKIILIIVGILFFLSVICGGFAYLGSRLPSTPSSTETAIPTQTSLPTYTPMPTYTPYPTAVPPTAVPPTEIPPTKIPEKPTQAMSSDYDEVECPSSVSIPAGLTAKCYGLNFSPVAVGMTFFSKGELVAIVVTWENSAPESVTTKAATFIVTEAYNGGWDIDDVQAITQKLSDASPDETVREGTLQAVWSESDGFTVITYGLYSFFG